MDERTAELIAIGAAYGGNCEACLVHHVRQAAEVGASIQDVQNAINIARQVREASEERIERLISHVMGEEP